MMNRILLLLDHKPGIGDAIFTDLMLNTLRKDGSPYRIFKSSRTTVLLAVVGPQNFADEQNVKSLAAQHFGAQWNFLNDEYQEFQGPSGEQGACLVEWRSENTPTEDITGPRTQDHLTPLKDSSQTELTYAQNTSNSIPPMPSLITRLEELAQELDLLPPQSEVVGQAHYSLLQVHAKMLTRLPVIEGTAAARKESLESARKSLDNLAKSLSESHEGIIILRKMMAITAGILESRTEAVDLESAPLPLEKVKEILIQIADAYDEQRELEAETKAIEAIKELGGTVETSGHQNGKPRLVVKFHKRISDVDLEWVSHLKNTVCVALPEGSISDHGMRHLAPLSVLAILFICRSRITEDGLCFVHSRDMYSLEIVDAEYRTLTFTEKGMQLIAERFNKINSLALHHCPIEENAIRHLARLGMLRELRLTWCRITDQGLKSISTLTGLTELDLTANHITDAGLDQIAKISGLRQLSLADNPIGVQRRGRLAHPERITSRGVEKFAALGNLLFLNLRGTGVAEPGLVAGLRVWLGIQRRPGIDFLKLQLPGVIVETSGVGGQLLHTNDPALGIAEKTRREKAATKRSYRAEPNAAADRQSESTWIGLVHTARRRVVSFVHRGFTAKRFDWLFGKKATGAEPASKAAQSQPSATPAGRELISNCTKCGSQFRWIDQRTGDEAPFCPNCGYDAVYAGRRMALDPKGHPQPAILPPRPNRLVCCDKCGATNKCKGGFMESIMPFTLYRCQSCHKSSCPEDGIRAFAVAYGGKQCPNCGEVVQFVAEEYDYV